MGSVTKIIISNTLHTTHWKFILGVIVGEPCLATTVAQFAFGLFVELHVCVCVCWRPKCGFKYSVQHYGYGIQHICINLKFEISRKTKNAKNAFRRTLDNKTISVALYNDCLLYCDVID